MPSYYMSHVSCLMSPNTHDILLHESWVSRVIHMKSWLPTTSTSPISRDMHGAGSQLFTWPRHEIFIRMCARSDIRMSIRMSIRMNISWRMWHAWRRFTTIHVTTCCARVLIENCEMVKVLIDAVLFEVSIVNCKVYIDLWCHVSLLVCTCTLYYIHNI